MSQDHEHHGHDHDRFASTLPWPPADAASYLPPAVLAACVPSSFDDFCRRMSASAAAGRLPAVLLVSAASWAHLRPQIEPIITISAAAAAAPASTAASSSSSGGSRGSGGGSTSNPVDILVVPLGEGFTQRARAAYAALPGDGPTRRLARQFGLDVALASLAAGDSAARGGYMPRSVPALLVARTAATATAAGGADGISMSGSSMSGSSIFGSLDEVEQARRQLMVMGGAATAAAASMDGHGSSSHGHGQQQQQQQGHRQKGGRRRRSVTFDGPYPAWCMRQELAKHVHRHAEAAAAAAAEAAAAQQELLAWQRLQLELQAHHQQQARRHEQQELSYLTAMQAGHAAALDMHEQRQQQGQGQRQGQGQQQLEKGRVLRRHV